ncbi:hypothetical protein CTI12_AA413020 [Artemisia annua]|uniref:Uncharacterized protein n=1 Tax=Artemisia annua TaxID=35608 RepID=A0A2U1M6P2_ARTAN|nr:hypothetical protein CTI12_AA413020 [Artemisia annua]
MRVGSDQDSSKSKKMGVMERLEWMNTCSKKQCRSLFWRMRAAMKKAVKNKHTFFVALYGGTKKQFNFQYDPSSYALNFDDAASIIVGGWRKRALAESLGEDNGW